MLLLKINFNNNLVKKKHTLIKLIKISDALIYDFCAVKQSAYQAFGDKR